MMNAVTPVFSQKELRIIQNDLIAYIWKIKEQVLGDCSVPDAVVQTIEDPQVQKELHARGYYFRVELLRKLRLIEQEAFGEPSCRPCDS